MDTETYPVATNGHHAGPVLDVDNAAADDLKMIAALLRRPVAEVFAEGVEHLRQTYLPTTKPTRSAEPKAPRQPKASK